MMLANVIYMKNATTTQEDDLNTRLKLLTFDNIRQSQYNTLNHRKDIAYERFKKNSGRGKSA